MNWPGLIACLFGLHKWTPWTVDDACPSRWCRRCGDWQFRDVWKKEKREDDE